MDELDEKIKIAALRDEFFSKVVKNSLPESARNEVLAEMSHELLENVALRIYKRLDAEQQKEFDEVFNGEDTERKFQFYELHAPDLDDLIIEEAENLIKDYYSR
jgi:hypothetical protein